MTSIDWSPYLQCTTCPAERGTACFLLSSGGPEALAPVLAGRPHSNRKRAGHAAAKRAAAAGPARNPTARRSASRTTSQADAWRALAAKQRGKP